MESAFGHRLFKFKAQRQSYVTPSLSGGLFAVLFGYSQSTQDVFFGELEGGAAELTDPSRFSGQLLSPLDPAPPAGLPAVDTVVEPGAVLPSQHVDPPLPPGHASRRDPPGQTGEDHGTRGSVAAPACSSSLLLGCNRHLSL